MKNLKKIILSVLLLLLVSGCDAVYNVEIYNDTCKEDATIIEDNSSNWYDKNQYGGTFKDMLDEEYNRDNYYYSKKMISTETELGLNYKGKLSLSDYDTSSIVYRCYDYFSMTEQDDSIVISTSKHNLCFDNYKWLDSLIVNVKTNHKVINNNADNVNGNTYTWNLTKYDNDRSIQIELSKDEYVFNYDNEVLKKFGAVAIVAGAITLVLIFVALYFYIKSKRANKI
jgi:hypothetical protein